MRNLAIIRELPKRRAQPEENLQAVRPIDEATSILKTWGAIR